jgi:hypothetical protein
MVKKIKEKEVEELKKGDIIVKYPIDGDAVNSTVDITNERQLLVMQVNQISGKNIDLVFEVPKGGIFINLMQVKMGPLHKDKNEMVLENKWWLYTE